MKKVVIIIVVAIAIIIGGILITQNKVTAPEASNTSTNENVVTPVTENTNVSTSTTARTVKEFTVNGDNFEFSLKEMKVKVGDTVRVNFVNAEGFHDWVIDEFNARTEKLQAGGKETIEFVANKAGTFEYYCSVGTHRQMGMKGNLIVEP